MRLEWIAISGVIAGIGFVIYRDQPTGQKPGPVRPRLVAVSELPSPSTSPTPAPSQTSASTERSPTLAPAQRQPTTKPSPEPVEENIDPVVFAKRFIDGIWEKVDGEVQNQMGLSFEEEVTCGRDTYESLLKHKRTIASESERLRRCAQPMLSRIKRSKHDYTFTALDDVDLNAFSHVGGYVYVNKGLLDFVGADDVQLQFVLGHEIAHIELGHCSESATVTVRGQEIGGDLVAAGAGIARRAAVSGFTKEYEFDADVAAYRALRAMGVSPDEGQSFLQRLLRLKPDKPAPSKRSLGGRMVGELFDHFRSHPRTTERLDCLKQFDRDTQPVKGVPPKR